jgi:DNA processing protein
MSSPSYWLAFQSVGLGWQSLQPLLKHFGSVEALWSASVDDIEARSVSPMLLAKIVTAKSFDLSRFAGFEKSLDFAIVVINDPRYPALLREIHSPPLVLYVRGSTTALTSRCLTVEPR